MPSVEVTAPSDERLAMRQSGIRPAVPFRELGRPNSENPHERL
jgi:hypothetical protein